MKIGLRKGNFWMSSDFSSCILVSKMNEIMNLRLIKKNNSADSKIGLLTKSNLKPFGRAMPKAWELKY